VTLHGYRYASSALWFLEPVLNKLPSNQRSLITEGQPVIVEIVVTEIKDLEKRVQNNQE